MSRRARQLHVALAGSLLVLAVSGRAVHAGPPLAPRVASAARDAPAPPPRAALAPCGAGSEPLAVVLLVPAPPAAAPDRAALGALRDAICDWFQGDRWSVSFSQQAALSDPNVRHLRLSLELRSSAADRPNLDAARLHIDTANGRSVHDVPLESGLDDAGLEAIAEALHSTAQAASAEAPPPARANALATPALEPKLDAPPASAFSTASAAVPAPRDDSTSDRASIARATGPVARGRHFPMHTALGYQAYARGAEPFMHGPALHVELDVLSHAFTLAGYFRASAFTSGTRRSAGFAVRSSGASLSLGAAASLPIGAAGLRAAASSGVDLVALDVRVIDPELVRSIPDRRVAPRPFSSLEAGVRYGLGSFELAADALVRWLWADTQYQVRSGERRLIVFQPWQLQPGAIVELGYVW
jgi:hypothetical protein